MSTPLTSASPLPPCPITGLPPRRHVQRLSKKLIRALWRVGQGVDVKHLLKGVKPFSLYESPTGLLYFDPPVAGDEHFYRHYYQNKDVQQGLTRDASARTDYLRAATFVPAGAHVLDIGCGPGLFRHHLDHARYTGLDPYATWEDPAIVRETLDAHAAAHAGAYDAVVAAFHVIEHVADPLRHAAQMAQLLKPGGLLILAAPLHPSPLTQIPNFVLNLPPHHLSWWNPDAFRALAAALDLEVIEASALPPSPHQTQIHWLHRLLLCRAGQGADGRHYAHRWSWHLSLLLAFALSKPMSRLCGLPRSAQPVDAFLVARKR